MNRVGITDLAFSTVDRGLQMKNARRPHVLIYTDSRGLNFASRLGKRHYGSHIWKLQRDYRVVYAACPEKHTTIVDFLAWVGGRDLAQFDAVILHCGIVDFSPRPMSNVAFIKKYKSALPEWRELFDRNASYHAASLGVEYEGEQTTTLYSPHYLLETLVPRLCEIRHLVWISSNPFVAGWDGNYTRGRPSNIGNVVRVFDDHMCAHLGEVVDLRHWSDAEVQRRTLDNVHFTRAGFRDLYGSLDQTLRKLLG